MTNPSATSERYSYQNEPTWSRSEKAVARAAFDAALGLNRRSSRRSRCKARHVFFGLGRTDVPLGCLRLGAIEKKMQSQCSVQ